MFFSHEAYLSLNPNKCKQLFSRFDQIQMGEALLLGTEHQG